MKDAGVLDQTTLIYGQMNEPPGARMRVALSGLTMAEYFRDVKNKTFYYLLITFSDIFKPVQKSLRYLDECLQLLGINQRYLMRWRSSRANCLNKGWLNYFHSSNLCASG